MVAADADAVGLAEVVPHGVVVAVAAPSAVEPDVVLDGVAVGAVAAAVPALPAAELRQLRHGPAVVVVSVVAVAPVVGG